MRWVLTRLKTIFGSVELSHCFQLISEPCLTLPFIKRRAFRNSDKAVLLEFSSRLSIANAREIFQGEGGTTLAAKGTTSARKCSAYPSYETPSKYHRSRAEYERCLHEQLCCLGSAEQEPAHRARVLLVRPPDSFVARHEC